MEEKELYKIKVWGLDKYALLLPYEAEMLKYQLKNLNQEPKIKTVRLIDGALVPSSSVGSIINALEINLLDLFNDMKKIYPNKMKSLSVDKTGKIIDSQQKMLGLSILPDHRSLYSFLFGNKMFSIKKYVKIKAYVTAAVSAEIEVPENCSAVDLREYIKTNSENLIISDISYDIDEIQIL